MRDPWSGLVSFNKGYRRRQIERTHPSTSTGYRAADGAPGLSVVLTPSVSRISSKPRGLTIEVGEGSPDWKRMHRARLMIAMCF